MKKTLFLAAALVFAAVSCNKQSLAPEAEPALTPMTFSAQVEDITRISLDGTSVSWVIGDQMAVYQYGKYNSTTNRDNSKNVFTCTDASNCVFSGSIANFQPMVSGGQANRFYFVYPADQCNTVGITTGKATVAVPSEQDGTISEAVFAGLVKSSDEKTTVEDHYTYEDGVLTLLKSVSLKCITPVIKFDVPADLNLSSIVITAKDENDVDVALAGNSQVRVNGKDAPSNSSTGTSITLSKGDDIISGTTYVALLPVTSTSDNDIYTTPVKTLYFALTTADGKSANLHFPISGEVKSGTLKTLSSLPDAAAMEGHWTLPVCTGDITKISSSTAGQGSAGKYLVEYTTEENAVLKYSASETSFDGVAEPSTTYPDAGIGRANMYARYAFVKDGRESKYVNAITWMFNKNNLFGGTLAAVTDLATNATVTGYGLTFTATSDGKGSNVGKAQVGSYGLTLMPSQSTNGYAMGYLTFTVPQDAKAGTIKMFFEVTNTSSTRTLTVTNTSLDPVQSWSVTTGNDSAITVYTISGIVAGAGDVLKVDFNSSTSPLLSDMSYVWEPNTASLLTATEGFSASHDFLL